MQDKKLFILFEDRPSDHPLVEKVWRCHSERADSFLSVAANNFEMAITRWRGRAFSLYVAPRRQQLPLTVLAEGEWVAIRFKIGNFMPAISARGSAGSQGCKPSAGYRTFFLAQWLAFGYPDFDNAETFVNRLAKSGVISHDPIVDETLQRPTCEVSLRSAQRHFLRSTGVTYATFRQIERARHATKLLQEGVSTFDVGCSLGYFDQAHLTRSLRHFIGQTPAQITQGQKQLSFLYKTNP